MRILLIVISILSVLSVFLYQCLKKEVDCHAQFYLTVTNTDTINYTIYFRDKHTISNSVIEIKDTQLSLGKYETKTNIIDYSWGDVDDCCFINEDGYYTSRHYVEAEILKDSLILKIINIYPWDTSSSVSYQFDGNGIHKMYDTLLLPDVKIK